MCAPPSNTANSGVQLQPGHRWTLHLSQHPCQERRGGGQPGNLVLGLPLTGRLGTSCSRMGPGVIVLEVVSSPAGREGAYLDDRAPGC